ncbi:MAG: beta strand repeat-containing protein, partial [Bacteroidia bacterium]
MKKFYFLLLMFCMLALIPVRSYAGHGMALVTPNFTIGATGVTFTASSNAATCGGGPYWLQMEVRCTAAQLTGTPPSTMQTQLLNWTGPGVTYNSFPWYNSLLNVPNYTLGNAWPDQCTTEPYNPIFVPYSGLCPGQTYYFACREWVSGTNSVGPWTAPQAFTVPGVFVPLNFNIAASPTIFCNPGCSTLTASSITGGCGSTSVLWTPGNSTLATNVVCPTASTNYTCMVSTPCNTVTKTVSVTVVPVVSAAFTPVNSTGCTGVPILFTHTGTAGGTHNWAVSPVTGVTISTPTSINPTITFANAGVYTISHTLTIGSCTNVVTTNITINSINPAFTTGSYTQCLNGNSFTFNATTAAGSHTFAFNPTVGAPATGLINPYGPVSFTAPGTYTVTHSINNGGCTASASSVIVINPQPSATTTQTNTTCGLNNGVIQITNTTGAGQTVTGFTFDSSPIGTQTIVNVAAGVHTIGVTNNFGCTTTYTVNITSTPGITALATTFTNATCGNANGSIGFGAVTGGTPTYSFAVNAGPFSSATTAGGLTAGTYTITVKDASGCTFTKTVTISNIPGPTVLNFTTTPSTCLTPAGSVTIGVVGGTAAFTYSVDGVTAGSTAGGLASGTHTATVKDANGCVITTTFNIGSVSGPSAASVVVTQATCGNANGSATVTTVTGGVGPYQYSFNGGPFSSTNNVGGLTAGTKTVVVKDANSCTLTVNFTIVNAGSPTLTVVGTTSVSCFGGNNGSFTVSTTGGTPGYNYTIVPTNATNAIGIFNTLTAQVYTVTVMDANGCTNTITATVAQPPALTLTLTPAAVPCNGGTNGTITAVGGGGPTPYQFSLDGGTFGASGNFTTVSAGTHTVTIKDNNGCTTTQTVSITQPPALALTFTTTPNTCVGAAGSVTIGVTGGTAAYSYSIDAVAAGATATGLSSGTHTATVKDSKGCTITATFSIGVITGPTAATVNTGNATCGSSNGTSTVTTVTGGLGPYQYSFDGGPFSLSNNAGSLTAGTHTVVVKDANSCTLTVTYAVNNTGSPVSTISASVNILCNGGATGSFTVNTTGGTPGYNYTLNPIGTTNTTGVFTGLTAQAYNVTVKDAVGCVTTVTITLTQPTALTLALTPAAVSCNGGTNGTITATGGGGTTPYQYSLDGGTFGASGTFTGISAGTHTVTLKDNNNCTITQTVSITQPPALALTFTATPNSCAGPVGSVTVGVTGGTPAYSFSVDALATSNTATGLSSGTHTATVKDSKGCTLTGTFSIGNITGPATATVSTTNANCGNANGSATVTGVTGGLAPYQYSFNGGPFSTTAILSGVTAGTKTLTVLDANGCSLTITFAIGNTGGPSSSVGTLSNVACFGGSSGSFTLNTSGGTPGYNYTISPTNVTSGTGIFTNLTAQNYTVTVKDAAGCVTTLTTSISQPSALSLTLTPFQTLCNASATGSITAAGAGGSGPYQYSLNGGLFQSSTTFTGVAAGIYNVTVKDNNGCTLTQTVSVIQPSAITMTFTSNSSKCTSANGTASVTPSGGTPAYSYTWSGGGGNSALTNSLVAGIYTVTVKDANGCIQTGVTTITATPGGSVVITASANVTCNGFANGSLTAGTTGPMTAPLSYNWSNSQITSTAINLAPGTYTCTVTDVFGCKAAVTGTITEPGVLDFGISSNSVTCYNGNNGNATVTYFAGGTPGFTYLWAAGGATTATAPNLPAGTYSCSITDANGCNITKTITVTQPTSVTLTSSVTTANCGQSNGSATVSAIGGTPAYSYTWSTSTTGPILTGAAAGTYTITVKDANNCSYTVAATIPNAAGPSIAIVTQTNVSCNGGNNGVATATATGGVAPYIFQWSNAQNTGTATNLLAGVYSCTVTDQMGCKASVSVTITQPAVLTVSTTATNPKCFGSLNGTANTGVLGGTGPYNYTWTPSGGNSAFASGLGAGNYIVTVVDAQGCVASSSVGLTNPPQMTAAISSTNVSCYGACNATANGSAANTVGVV